METQPSPKPKRPTPTVECRVPPAIHRAVKLQAALENRPIADLVADAIDAYLPETIKAEGARLASAS